VEQSIAHLAAAAVSSQDPFQAAGALICLDRWLHRASHEEHHGHCDDLLVVVAVTA